MIVVPNPYLTTSGTGLVYTHTGRHSTLSLSVGAYNIAPAFYSVYSTPYYVAPYGYNGINQVTVVYTAQPTPPAGLPFVAAAPRALRLDDLGMLDPDLRADPPDKPKQPPPDPKLPGGRDAGVFRPLAPDNRDRAVRPVPPEPPPRPAPQPPERDLPRPVPPEADAKVDGERQLKLGREAYAAREYGRAIQRFREAARRTPDDAMPYFLLGQSLFAAGRYPEAVEAIRAGVGLRPDWPKARFTPRDLYGPIAAVFVDHLRRLREALDLLPDDHR